MSDLISRSALIEALEKEQNEHIIAMTSPNFYTAKKIVKEQPTIEAVPVVERNKVIDEFVKEAMKQFTELELNDKCPTVTDCKILLRNISEKMKGGAE